MEQRKATIKRCLNEVGIAMMEWHALKGMEKSKGWFAGGFFHIANIAIYNDMMAHMIKVLDDNRKSRNFNYIIDNVEDSEKDFLGENYSSNDIAFIKSIWEKLRNVRVRTHFHIDKDYVSKHEKVWKDADIKTDEFFKAMKMVFNILNKLHYFYFETDFPFSSYDGEDAAWIINLVNKEEGWE